MPLNYSVSLSFWIWHKRNCPIAGEFFFSFFTDAQIIDPPLKLDISCLLNSFSPDKSYFTLFIRGSEFLSNHLVRNRFLLLCYFSFCEWGQFMKLTNAFLNILDNVTSFHYVAVSIQYWLDLQTKQSRILCPSLPGSWRSSTNPQFTANTRTYITVQSKLSIAFLANFVSWLTKDPMGMVNPGCFTVSSESDLGVKLQNTQYLSQWL